MSDKPDCDECRRLLDLASVAITRELRAIARLDSAQLNPEVEDIRELVTAVGEAKLTRENAVTAYREHRRRHSENGEQVLANGA